MPSPHAGPPPPQKKKKKKKIKLFTFLSFALKYGKIIMVKRFIKSTKKNLALTLSYYVNEKNDWAIQKSLFA